MEHQVLPFGDYDSRQSLHHQCGTHRLNLSCALGNMHNCACYPSCLFLSPEECGDATGLEESPWPLMVKC